MSVEIQISKIPYSYFFGRIKGVTERKEKAFYTGKVIRISQQYSPDSGYADGCFIYLEKDGKFTSFRCDFNSGVAKQFFDGKEIKATLYLDRYYERVDLEDIEIINSRDCIEQKNGGER